LKGVGRQQRHQQQAHRALTPQVLSVTPFRLYVRFHIQVSFFLFYVQPPLFLKLHMTA
jgi:hypothetical protein